MASGIEKITEKIMSDAEEYAERVKREARFRAERIVSEAKARAEVEYAEAVSKNEKELAGIAKRAVSSSGVLERNVLLDARLRLAEMAFARAEEALDELVFGAPYADFLQRRLTKAVETLCADGETNETVLVILCERDLKMYKARLSEAIAPTAREKGLRLGFSETCDKIRGGFILGCGGTEINATLEALLKETKEKTLKRVCDVLFDGTDG